MKKSLFLCLLLCMALLLSACGTSPAPAQPDVTDAPAATETPAPEKTPAPVEFHLSAEQETALAAAQAALDELYDLGLLSSHHHLDPVKASYLGVTEPDQKANTFNDRILPPCYQVSCGTEEENWVSLYVSIESGKALACSIATRPQEGDAQLDKEPIDMDGRKLYFYDNFERVMREDMTLDDYCALLNDYWGFDTEPPAGDTLMKDLMDAPFVTLYFEGDQEGMPMFLEGSYFPGDTHFTFGFFHMVG